MADIYIDTSKASNGDGSSSSPYNSFIEANNLTGDLSGDIISIASGTTTREQLKLSSASNFSIGVYGNTDAPIITGSDIVSASWALDVSNGFYYLSSADNHGLFVDGEQVIDVATEGALTGTTSWYDSGSNRLYISFNPTGYQFEITTRAAGAWLSACSNFTIRDLILERADDSCMTADAGCVGGHFYGLTARYAGGWRSDTGRGGLLIKGVSGTPSTGVVIKNCNSHDNQNCGQEIHFLDGADIQENILTDNSNGFELWQGMVNSDIKRNRVTGSVQRGTSTGHQNGVWIAGNDQSGTGDNASNVIAYNIFENCEADGVIIEDGLGHLVHNNTMYSCGQIANGRAMRFIQKGTIQVGATVKNNIIVLTGDTQYAVQIGDATDSTTKNNILMQDNQYYHETDTASPRYQIDTTTYSSAVPAIALANFKAALPTQDTTSDWGNPAFIDTIDFELHAISPCINAGEDVSETIDFRKYPIYGLPDRGAMEKKLMLDVTTSMGEL